MALDLGCPSACKHHVFAINFSRSLERGANLRLAAGAESHSRRRELSPTIAQLASDEFSQKRPARSRQPSERRQGHARANQVLASQLREAGYLAVSWPKEYGCQAMDPASRAFYNEEMVRVRPWPCRQGHPVVGTNPP